MLKRIKMPNVLKQFKILLLIVALSIPAFFRMVRPGIHSMQDFHLFRLHEFHECVTRLELPCRWSANAGLGYGEPLFNFYPQLPYAVGEMFHLMGLSLIDSTKLLFILSLVLSALAMYALSKKLWDSPLAGILSAAVYLFAPYRAIDVWVRGALPESLAFILFPLIILAIEKKKIWTFTLLMAGLILTHNLSALMFMPVILAWIIYRKYWKGIWGIALSLITSSFYLLPVVFESKFINIESTTLGYFDFRAHFITLKQIFLSTYWGYGGSTWGDGDGLNLSIGIIQWVLPSALLLITFAVKRFKVGSKFLIFFLVGLTYLFLMHNRSAVIWEALPFMKFIQFPWRFLGVALFCLSVSSGYLVKTFKKGQIVMVSILVLLLISLNQSYFREDIWYSVDDNYFLTGQEWDRQRTASIGDFWPNLGHEIPVEPASGEHINYFPGWVYQGEIEGGLIKAEGAELKNTPVRTAGNIISLVSICLILLKIIFF